MQNTSSMPRIAAIGEVMIELSPASHNQDPLGQGKNLAFAGDSYNTAITLARLGIPTSYCTRLGDDAYSEQILQQLICEGIATDSVVKSDGDVPGLYMINNTSNGEREFLYWRSNAPARQLFSIYDEREKLVEHLSASEWLYFSGISLAILSAPGREFLFQFLTEYRAKGGKVAFDSNYRPRLWASVELAQTAMMAAMAQTDLALLTLDDEALLWEDGNLEASLERYKDLDIPELVFKRGAEDVIVFQGTKKICVPVKPVHNIIDTTAAGDTFNAGYIAARLNQLTPELAAQQASRCAGIIIQHRGGVIDKNSFLTQLALAQQDTQNPG